MTYAAADVHAAIAGQFNFTGNVTPVVNRQKWRRQKRRLALATVRVSREDPALVSAPDGIVGGVRIVAEHDGGRVLSISREDFCRIETRAPEIFNADKLQARSDGGFVAQHGDSRIARDLHNLVGDIDHSPVQPVVVIAEDAEGAKRP